jgi:hypothetical protein
MPLPRRPSTWTKWSSHCLISAALDGISVVGAAFDESSTGFDDIN